MDNETKALILSLVAMVIMVLSFQVKKKNLLLVVQSTGQLTFLISFLCLGAKFGIILNAISICRNLLYIILKDNKKGQSYVLYATIVLQILAYFVFIFVIDTTADKLFNFFPIVSVLLMTLSMFFVGRKFRFIKMIEASGWLVYDIWLGIGELGGILSDSFCIISGFIAYLRFKDDNVNGEEVKSA